MIRLLPCVLVALLFSHAPASAHALHGESGGFSSGFLHPLLGLDHLLAMFAVGLWAWQLGGRARWAVPAAFVVIMLFGFGFGASGMNLPLVEPAIISSVFILGLFVMLAVRMPIEAACGLVGVFALFHGYAHGAEMPGGASLWLYAAGFALATALLHAGGIGLGLASARFSHPVIVRAAGALVILAGLFVLAG